MKRFIVTYHESGGGDEIDGRRRLWDRAEVLFLLVMLICAVGAGGGLVFHSQSPEDVLRLLRARDASAVTYRMSVIYTSFPGLGRNEVETARKALRALEKDDPSGENSQAVAEGILKPLVGNRPFSWKKVDNVQRGEEYKTVVFFPNSPQSSDGARFSGKRAFVLAYDGQRYMEIRPDMENHQVDIYPIEPSLMRCGLDDLGIRMRKILREEGLTCQIEGDRATLTLSRRGDPPLTWRLEYNAQLDLRYSRSETAGRVVAEWWSVSHTHPDNYSVPSLIFGLYPGLADDNGSLDCYVVEKIEINCEVKDEELRVGDIPLWATVVDHYHDPPVVRSILDSPRVTLTLGQSSLWNVKFEKRGADQLASTTETQRSAAKQNSPNLPYRTRSHEEGEHDEEEVGARGSVGKGTLFVLVVAGALALGAGLWWYVGRRKRGPRFGANDKEI